MRTPASVAGHPIHVMLVVFPLGLWFFSLVCDLISLRVPNADTWAVIAFVAMVGGLIGGLAAAVPGLIDLLSIRDSAVKRVALTHMAINLVVVALYAVNIWMRANGSGNTGTPLVLSAIGVLLLGVSGWLGGDMVHRRGVSVDIAPEPAAATESPPRGGPALTARRAQH